MRSELITLWAAGVATMLACSASTGGDVGTTPIDAGARDTGAQQDSTSPIDSTTGVECVLPDGGAAPRGTLLVRAPHLIIYGVTSDDHAIYYDVSSGTLNAIPLAGGEPVQIGPGGWSYGPYIVGSVVVFFNGPDPNNTVDGGPPAYIASMTAWTAAHGAKTIAQTALAGNLAVSSDNKYLLYYDNPTDTTADVVVIGVDGTGRKVLLPAASFNVCTPNFGFVGASVVTASCPATVDPEAGAGPFATITEFSGAGWLTSTPLAADAYTVFGHDTAGTQIYYYTAAGLYSRILAVAPGKFIAGTFNQAMYTNAGSAILYLSGAGNLHSSTGSADSLIATGPFTGISALSSDDKWVVLYHQPDPMKDLYDISVVSTTPASTPKVLATNSLGLNGPLFLGDFFTKDNAHLLFGTNGVQVTATGLTGDYNASALPPVGPARKLAAGVWQNYATFGPKTVYNDNFQTDRAGYSTADIEALDDVGTGVPSLIASQADLYFYLSSNKQKLAYSWSYCANELAGLYVMDTP